MVDLEHVGLQLRAGRAGHRGEPGAPGGTNNGPGFGTSSGDGVELMANAIQNRIEWQRKPKISTSPNAFMPRKAA
jgi:hypothetical protein